MCTLNQQQARAAWKSILRHHPFFRAGGRFGFDWRTFRYCYPSDCDVLREVVTLATGETVRYTVLGK